MLGLLESASSFVKHIRSLHKEISDKINLSNQRYKWLADSRQQVKNFAKDDHIMIRVRSEQFSPEIVRKLHAQETGISKISKKVGLIMCVIDLPPDYGISLT